MRRVAIFGGAFDPVTIGHLRTALYVTENTDVDEVWMLPCPTHRYNKSMAPLKDRLHMLEGVVRSHSKLKVSNYEGEHKLPGDTYSLVQSLKSNPEHTNIEFQFVIGLDNANTIDRWYRGDELLQLIPFIVTSRPGENITSMDWYKKAPHVDLTGIKMESVPVSSTMARVAASRQDYGALANLLPPAVLEWVTQKQLYGYQL